MSQFRCCHSFKINSSPFHDNTTWLQTHGVNPIHFSTSSVRQMTCKYLFYSVFWPCASGDWGQLIGEEPKLSTFLSAHPSRLQPWLNRTHARIIKLIKIPFKETHGHGQYFILSQKKTVRQLQVYQIMHTVPFDRLPTCSISHGDGWQFQNGWTQKAIDIHWLFNLTNQPTSRELNAWKTDGMVQKKWAGFAFCACWCCCFSSSIRTWRCFLLALHYCLFRMRNECSAIMSKMLSNTFSSSSHSTMPQAITDTLFLMPIPVLLYLDLTESEKYRLTQII